MKFNQIYKLKKIVNINEGEERIKEILKICIFKKKVETWFLKCIMLFILLCKWQQANGC
jgi:hypothetical protein